MHRRHKHIILLTPFVIIAFFGTYTLEGQEFNQSKDKYIWFDNILGPTNSGIFKGVLYVNEYKTINEKHQFFESSAFRLGSVIINDQCYFDVPLKYDVYLDNLLAQNQELANRPVIVFDRASIVKFTIDGHTFELVKVTMAMNEPPGFFEVILKNDFLTFYKKHTRKVFKRTDEKTLYYEFKSDYHYLICSGDAYYRFKKVKELNRFFPEYEKEIKGFDKQHETLRKLDTDGYLKALLSELPISPLAEKGKSE